jgi:hypothetical protein
MDANRILETAGVLISVSPSRREAFRCGSNAVAVRANKQLVERKAVAMSKRQQTPLMPARSLQQ